MSGWVLQCEGFLIRRDISKNSLITEEKVPSSVTLASDNEQPWPKIVSPWELLGSNRYETITPHVQHLSQIVLPIVHDVEAQWKLRHNLLINPQVVAPLPIMPHVHRQDIRLQSHQMQMRMWVLFRLPIKVGKLAL